MKIDQRNDEIFFNYFSNFCIALFFFLFFFIWRNYTILGYTEHLQVYTKFVCVFYWRQNQELFI